MSKLVDDILTDIDIIIAGNRFNNNLIHWLNGIKEKTLQFIPLLKGDCEKCSVKKD